MIPQNIPHLNHNVNEITRSSLRFGSGVTCQPTYSRTRVLFIYDFLNNFIFLLTETN